MPAGSARQISRSLSLLPDLRSLRDVRRFVADAAREAGFSDERVFDITVASSEATANAMEHTEAGREVKVETRLFPTRLEISIRGAGEFEVPDRSETRQHRGLGLPLMAKLSDNLALFSDPGGGTLVTLSFYRPGAARPMDEQALPPSLRELIEENELVSTITQNAPIGIAVLGPDLRYRWTNPAYQDFLDEPYRSAELVGIHIGDVVPNAEESGLLSDLREVSATCTPQMSDHYQLLGYSRGPTWWRRSIVPLPGDGGSPCDLLLVVSEETERMLAEEALRRSREDLDRAQEVGQMGSWRMDTRTDTLDWSDETYRIFGVEKGLPQTYESFLEAIYPDDREHVDARWRAALEGDAYEVEHRLIAGEEVKWVREKAFLEFDDFGRLQGGFGIVQDITEGRRAEMALNESEENFRALADNIPQLAWMADATGYIYWYNRRWYEYTGKTSSEMEGWGWQSVHDPSELPRVLEGWQRSIATGEPFEMEFPLRGADGVFRRFLTRVMPLRDDQGKVTRWFGTNTDITEAAELRAALSHELETTRLLLKAAEAAAEWTNLERLLEGLLGVVLEATSHTRATLVLWDAQARELRSVASAGSEPFALSSASLSGFSPDFQRAVAGRKTALVDYDRLPAGEKRMADVHGAHAALLVPLVYRGGLVGMLLVDDPQERAEFTTEEIRVVEGIAAQAAVAIENARLFEAQRNIADTLQQILLDVPQEMPGIRFSHLYRSATEQAAVGGDFYDVIALERGGSALVIGDVSGHGIEAARLATFVKDTLNALAAAGRDAEEILTLANQALIRRGISGFVSVLLAVLSPDRRRLRFCSAGHPNLVVLRASGETSLVGEHNALPLGVTSSWSCTLEDLRLEPGDTLLLYTDGVIEARIEGQMFGERRLLEWLEGSAGTDLEELPSALLAAVLDFSDGVLQDDVAILAVAPDVGDPQ